MKTILQIEDNYANKRLVERVLEPHGYRLLHAADGRSGIDVALQEHPDLILMDLSLPRLDGLDATRRIRELEGLTRVPIVAVSAHDTNDFHADALAAGCNAYVTKPIDFDFLKDLLNNLLN